MAALPKHCASCGNVFSTLERYEAHLLCKKAISLRKQVIAHTKSSAVVEATSSTVPAGHTPGGHRLSFRHGALQLVNIIIGTSEEIVQIHKSPLCEVSPYFNNTLDGRFLEAETNTLTLPDTTQSTFLMFLEWLYGRKVPDQDDETRRARSINLIELYIFGDKFDVAQLREDALDTFRELFDTGTLPSKDACAKAFDNLPEDSPLLRYMIDDYCNRFKPTISDEQESESTVKAYPHRLTALLLVKMAKHRPSIKRSQEQADLCAYHEHKSDGEKLNCKKKRMGKQDT